MGDLEKIHTLFEIADDIPNSGVLCALPALLAIGLLRHTESHVIVPAGYYPMESIFLLLAHLALGRFPSLEQLRYQAPGEWGKLPGLDRIPEVKTLREKTSLLGDAPTRTARWSSQLARNWMEHDVQAAGVLLIDGHARVYHSSLTKLPRRYVSRERLCLRGTTDYRAFLVGCHVASDQIVSFSRRGCADLQRVFIVTIRIFASRNTRVMIRISRQDADGSR